MIEFLLLLGLIWLLVASLNDIKKREIPNWVSFSLIIFALVFRLIYSVLNSYPIFFIYGLFGFAVFFILAYAFYYGRIFAGGDAKLLMGLGVLVTISFSFYSNLLLIGLFVLLFMFTGGIWGLAYSFVLVLGNKKNFSREFKNQLVKRKKIVWYGFGFFLLAFLAVLLMKVNMIFLLASIIFLLLPLLFIYAWSVEESCMIKELDGKKVTVGDWLYEEVKIGKKRIKPNWEGLSEQEVLMLRKSRKKIKIKQGIPFTPSFLLAYLIFHVLNFRIFS